MAVFTESIVEQAALAWLEGPRCGITHGIETLSCESTGDQIIGRGC
jgi:hypothetical protein